MSSSLAQEHVTIGHVFSKPAMQGALGFCWDTYAGGPGTVVDVIIMGCRSMPVKIMFSLSL
eukprot:1161738-Pelagomonas_calceolata.AAC.2